MSPTWQMREWTVNCNVSKNFKLTALGLDPVARLSQRSSHLHASGLGPRSEAAARFALSLSCWGRPHPPLANSSPTRPSGYLCPCTSPLEPCNSILTIWIPFSTPSAEIPTTFPSVSYIPGEPKSWNPTLHKPAAGPTQQIWSWASLHHPSSGASHILGLLQPRAQHRKGTRDCEGDIPLQGWPEQYRMAKLLLSDSRNAASGAGYE